ncbi:MAG: cytochrome c [Hyphomicrobiaceae bacterium]|nr:MAG: cytochrome c [Hyphomicrobiaceae bacterium]
MSLQFAAAVSGALVCAMWLAGPASAQSSPKARGEALVEKHCARCHAVRAEGDSPLSLAPPFGVLPSRYPVEQLAEALAEGIFTGHPQMPRFVFQPSEIDAILTYIDSLAPASPRLPPKR